ncbi:M13 family metallopeptidase [Inhella proteolytica]|uniref:M13 family metallopeptidase n=1 Tax=Inhella proteolytica TaxID=2795029 RepID=A0A931NFU5_9BURK|nr:M13 family metallopeptidase [Inhella proteolytica]MBH9576466.1 M13 family metallopeptidase [Inhella proteolytica]
MKISSLSLALAAALGLGLARADDQPLRQLPYTPSLDVSAMDRSVDPCEDLYQYACGGWMKNNPIPADEARWGVYSKVANENRLYLWGVLQELAQPAATARSAQQQQLGDYFGACMNEQAVNEAGLKPLKPLLERIDALRHKRDLPALLAALHLLLDNERAFFRFASGQDFNDATQVIAFVSAGGLGLPERDLYLKNDARSRKLRAEYQAHVARSLARAGAAAEQAQRQARSVLAFETELARATLSPVQRRDPYKLSNRLSFEQLQALTAGFDWAAYRSALGVEQALPVLNVTEPRFIKRWAALLQQTDLATLKTLLRWQVLSSQAEFLDAGWQAEQFGFYGKTLQGVPAQKARWKRCVELVDAQLGEALGQEFVARNFSPELKERVIKMTDQIKAAMARRIEALDWMSPATKARAQEKLASMVNKVGYPDNWRDYSAFQVRRDDFLGNLQRGNAFELKRQLAKIGKPLDRGEWGMTPQTVNAYYNAQMNDINFPAAVLQPPLYDAKLDDAPSYGNTGGTIGHELIHGFDDEGRQFDAQGRLKDWWTTQDTKAFERRAACVSKQYGQYTVIDQLKINSQLTLGEDLADLGGLVLALEAWKEQIKGLTLENRDGLTPEQRFFVGFAQWDCSHARPEYARLHAATDPHSPGRYRINGVAVNMPEFAQAFACKPGQKMVKKDAERCRVW